MSSDQPRLRPIYHRLRRLLPLVTLAVMAGSATRVELVHRPGRATVEGLPPEQWLDRWHRGALADSLHALLGQPAGAPLPVTWWRGRHVGRYLPALDRVHLDVAAVTAPDELGGALDTAGLASVYTHELAHQAAARLGPSLARVWAGVPPITDTATYGYGQPREHQASALAAAVGFLRQSAGVRSADPVTHSFWSHLLGFVERDIPGTRRFVALWLSHPAMADHPLRTGALVLEPALVAETPPWEWAALDDPADPLTRMRHLDAAVMLASPAPAVAEAPTPAPSLWPLLATGHALLAALLLGSILGLARAFSSTPSSESSPAIGAGAAAAIAILGSHILAFLASPSTLLAVLQGTLAGLGFLLAAHAAHALASSSVKGGA